jgi:hypothetical protein
LSKERNTAVTAGALVLNHYMRAIAGTLVHFATSTEELRRQAGA